MTKISLYHAIYSVSFVLIYYDYLFLLLLLFNSIFLVYVDGQRFITCYFVVVVNDCRSFFFFSFFSSSSCYKPLCIGVI